MNIQSRRDKVDYRTCRGYARQVENRSFENFKSERICVGDL